MLHVLILHILIFKDNEEGLKELTKEERRALEKEAMIRKGAKSYYAKEEALHINTKD